jgi:hypothetical protein
MVGVTLMSRFCFGLAKLAFVGAAGAAASPAPAQAASAANDTPAAAPAVTLPMLGMTGPLAANPRPTHVDAGPFGDIYITGAVTGIGFVQDHEVPGDHLSRVDLGNGQVFVQKIDGPIQFFVQAGGYSLPSLGTAYVRTEDLPGLTYGVVEQAFIKLVPSSHFNIMAAKLPTLSGAEYTFTFENMNIDRGLLWNQENAVNRGVQANCSNGPLTISLSLNDGYYSNRYNWLSGLIALALSPRDTVTIVAMGNVGRTARTASRRRCCRITASSTISSTRTAPARSRSRPICDIPMCRPIRASAFPWVPRPMARPCWSDIRSRRSSALPDAANISAPAAAPPPARRACFMAPAAMPGR